MSVKRELDVSIEENQHKRSKDTVVSVLSKLLIDYIPPSKYLSYGTAGFRDRFDLPLDSIFVRMGVLATLRSRHLSLHRKANKCVGVMITASHNPEQDNGIKIVDDDGGMLSQEWEPYAESIANSKYIQDVSESCLEMISNLESSKSTFNGVVIVGRDTRSHSLNLSNCVKCGVQSLTGTVLDLGEVSTPILHFVVQNVNILFNDVRNVNQDDVIKILDSYYSTILTGYLNLRNTCLGEEDSTDEIVVDASAGVGALSIHRLQALVEQLSPKSIKIDLRNDLNCGLPVNENVGAEYVQKNQLLPKGFDKVTDANRILCSFDGDADRIVFHSLLENGNKWILLDGDKIATIVALLFSQELREIGLMSKLSMCVVQTAYANGASTKFLKDNGIHVAIAKTGVKYLHHVATHYDIGIYFEANGHGTVLLSENFNKEISLLDEKYRFCTSEVITTDRNLLAYKRLKACLLAINQSVGDALSDMLLTLAALRILKLNIESWYSLYYDLPSKQLKVPVKNKSIIVCSEDETTVVSPVAVQEQLNIAMSSIPSGRCFIRPSGTEDVVRVYAEALNQIQANELADKAVDIIKTMIG